MFHQKSSGEIMKLIDSYMFLEKLRDLIYGLLEYRDRVKESGLEIIPIKTVTPLVKLGFISMLKGGVIMDVTNEDQAGIAEDTLDWLKNLDTLYLEKILRTL